MMTVTRIIKKFTPEFDLETLSAKVAKKLGVSQEQIKAEWLEKGNRASKQGNEAHEYFANFFMELNKTKNLEETYKKHRNTIKAETLEYLNIFINEAKFIKSEDTVIRPLYNLTGTPDVVFINDNKVSIIDYKTNNQIKTVNTFESLLPPFHHLDNTNLNIYTLQLSLYAYMYELAGFDIEKLIILHIDKDTSLKQPIQVRYLKEEAVQLAKEAQKLFSYPSK